VFTTRGRETPVVGTAMVAGTAAEASADVDIKADTRLLRRRALLRRLYGGEWMGCVRERWRRRGAVAS
jgi:hypothetical protein